jgi:hypothetical protein
LYIEKNPTPLPSLSAAKQEAFNTLLTQRPALKEGHGLLFCFLAEPVPNLEYY